MFHTTLHFHINSCSSRCNGTKILDKDCCSAFHARYIERSLSPGCDGWGWPWLAGARSYTNEASDALVPIFGYIASDFVVYFRRWIVIAGACVNELPTSDVNRSEVDRGSRGRACCFPNLPTAACGSDWVRPIGRNIRANGNQFFWTIFQYGGHEALVDVVSKQLD